ncbi:Williams-Beuren syndrome chromosomal region 14 protein [Trachymyrmex zeteki]|uniref:Williams-Beuren syndrome chromosomal region 14 protein n=1 Tax=Mycetomoellerius zeteki TaxID=64791 RepID=A0A151WMZ0_9HYME|nr:PREDICTED: MLX-interacting protein isoform X1 [Trachymyrmex zeteki]KYQ49180.1 Williams-Beuren syndrome chromosomal region 14 protein [Trachymyrmex zeteki]
MQAELMYRKPSAMTSQGGFHRAGNDNKREKNGGRDSRETIHSGHFMVSDFEAEAQDDEDELAVPVPDQEEFSISATPGFFYERFASSLNNKHTSQQLSIETSLNKLFQCMSLAYRQKLTSPKWNRFKGIRLRWKDKIRLNNVIWRCWHMQFILKQNTLVCQFASPLDVDTHNKPEAVVLEGKYWKRKLAAVTAEYKKWRMFYRNKILGWTNKDGIEMMESMDMLDWGSGCGTTGNFGAGTGNVFGNTGGASGGESMMVDEDYMELMTDTLFSTISSNQPIYFPDPREIARGASLADFIQPSLGPLQPNLDDFMDTLEPLQEFLNSKLPPVPEEDDMFRNNNLNTNYPDLDLMTPINQMNEIGEVPTIKNEQTVQQLSQEEQEANMQNLQYTAKIYTQPQPETANMYRNNIAMSQNYALQPNFEASVTTNQPIREKTRGNRGLSRNSRGVQQSQQQQQQDIYQATAQQQNSGFQSQPPQSYAMEIQAVRLTPVQNQPQSVQITTLNDQSAVNASHIPAITAAAVQNLVAVQHNFATQAVNSQLQTQHQTIRPLPTTSPMSSKPYKIVQPQQQCYKFPNLVQNLNAQQCKFNTNSFKTHPTQQVVSSEQPSQSQILLQCRSSSLDLTTSTLHTKLLPQPTTSNVEKEEIFAVPKYQMKGRNRSRSSSSLTAPRIHPPPLVSAVSDPALNLNNNVLLAHLLTNSKVTQVTTTQHITTPVTVQTMQTSSIQQTQPQQQTMQPSTAQQILLNAKNQTHQSHNSPIGSPKDSSSNAHSPQALSLSPLHSPMSIGSPLSPTRGYMKNESERGQYKEQRRVGHIHAEQKRRYNIKNGFDMLHSLIPQLSQNSNAKLSKAAMLQKGADYIRQLKAERHQLKDEMDSLRQQIECLNMSISNCQSMLPATGAPVSRHRTSKIKEMFDEYVRVRTQENWKFWIFSILLEPLMLSFNASVSTASIEDLYRSTLLWVDQHCSLVDLRPAVLNSLKSLCTATDILSDPTRLPEEALAAVNRTERRRSMQ